MTKELTIISPEGLEVANSYLVLEDITAVSMELGIPQHKIVDLLNKREVKKYIDNVYMDQGFRNRHKIGSLLDEIIESKLEEAKESEQYSNKDLADLLQMAHKMRMDELKHQEVVERNSVNVRHQTNVQINDTNAGIFGQGKYGALVQELFNRDTTRTHSSNPNSNNDIFEPIETR